MLKNVKNEVTMTTATMMNLYQAGIANMSSLEGERVNAPWYFVPSEALIKAFNLKEEWVHCQPASEVKMGKTTKRGIAILNTIYDAELDYYEEVLVKWAWFPN